MGRCYELNFLADPLVIASLWTQLEMESGLRILSPLISSIAYSIAEKNDTRRN